MQIFVKTPGESFQINTNKLGIIVPIKCISMTTITTGLQRKSIMERDFYVIIVTSDRCAAPGALQSPYTTPAYECRDRFRRLSVSICSLSYSVWCYAVTAVMNLKGMKTRTFNGLNKWKTILLFLYKIVASMPAWIHAVIKAKGRHTK